MKPMASAYTRLNLVLNRFLRVPPLPVAARTRRA